MFFKKNNIKCFFCNKNNPSGSYFPSLKQIANAGFGLPAQALLPSVVPDYVASAPEPYLHIGRYDLAEFALQNKGGIIPLFVIDMDFRVQPQPVAFGQMIKRSWTKQGFADLLLLAVVASTE